MIDEKIAIIGMSLRVPGAENYSEFWDNLIQGKDSTVDFTDESLQESGIPDELIHDPFYIKRKGIIKNIEFFEPQFFGISPAEAKIMDPQLRIFLELVWEALEDAGYYSEKQLGVVSVVGSQGNKDTYTEINLLGNKSVQAEYSEFFRTINHGNDFLATRIAYLLNFTGVSFTIQSACSSSLLAIAQACVLIQSRQCDAAIAGGIHIAVPHLGGYLCEKDMILSPSGLCRPFDSQADGTLPGHGGGVVLLKRLSDAIRDKDNIHAVIQGIGMNNDGKNKIGFAAPSIDGQKKAIKQAMNFARLMPEEISFVETHGTGTPTGDPIEVAALNDAYAEIQTDFHKLPKQVVLGSVKSNMGHLYAAAGVVGFIKSVCSLQYKTFPGTVHFEQPNPLLNLQQTGFFVCADPVALPDRPLLNGAVSSFGVGGTNVHVVLANYETHVIQETEQTGCDLTNKPSEFAKTFPTNIEGEPVLIPLSARTRESLLQMVTRLKRFISSYEKVKTGLKAIGYTLQTGRKPQTIRECVVVSNRQEFILWLTMLENSAHVFSENQYKSQRIVYEARNSLDVSIEQINQIAQAFPVFYCSYEKLKNIILQVSNIDIQCESEINCHVKVLRSFALSIAIFDLFHKLGINFTHCRAANEGIYAMGVVSGVFSIEEGTKLLMALLDDTASEPLFCPNFQAPKIKWLSEYSDNIIEDEQIDKFEFWTFKTEHSKMQMHECLSHVAVNENLKISVLTAELIEINLAEFLSPRTIMDAIGALWKTGCDIQWEYLYSDDHPYRISLPTYPFSRSKYWIDRINSGNLLQVTQSTLVKPLTGQMTQDEIIGQIIQIFSHHLEVGELDETSNFFALGGDSITGAHVIKDMEKAFGISLSLVSIFTCSTPREMFLVLLQKINEKNSSTQIINLTSIDNSSHCQHALELDTNVRKVPNRYKATPTQKRFWFLEKSQSGSFSHYNVPLAWRFNGTINLDTLKKILNQVVSHHDLLRSNFSFDGNEVWVTINEEVANYLDVQDSPKDSHALIQSYAGCRFDLEHDVLFKVHVIYESEKSGAILFNFHHTIIDGTSLDIVLQDIATSYNSMIRGIPNPFEMQDNSYMHTAEHYNQWLYSSEYTSQLAYWCKSLAGYQRANLRTDCSLHRKNKVQGARYSIELSDQTVAKIEAFSRQHQLTQYMVLFGIFNLLIAKYSGVDDIVIGTVAGNRENNAGRRAVGPCINTLPVRVRINFHQALATFFQQVKAICIEAFHHQQVPFENILQELGLPRHELDNPLYQVMFILQNQNENYQLFLDGVVTRPINNFYNLAQTDLTFNLKKHDNKIAISVEYIADLFHEKTVAALVKTYIHLITQIVNEKIVNLAQLTWVDEEYSHQFIANFIANKKVNDSSIISEFEKWVNFDPHRIALSVGNLNLSYRILANNVNKLANYLASEVHTNDRNIAICMPRNEWLIISLLASMKLGWAYIPIDPTYPPERIKLFLDESAVKNIIIWNDLTDIQHHLAAHQRIICLASIIEDILSQSDAFNQTLVSSPESHLYQIFTSGSTGTPKLVAVKNSNALNLLHHFRELFANLEAISFLSITSISFDIFFLEFMLPLFMGGKTILEPCLLQANLNQLIEKIRIEKPMIMQATPTTWEVIAPALKMLDYEPFLLVGGEALKAVVADHLLEISSQVFNVYGPTETTVWSTINRLRANTDLFLGQPIRNTLVVIVDADKHIVPMGMIGEIYIGGDGVSAGYWNDSLLTQKKFLSGEALGLKNCAVPFYQTGDIGFYDAAGQLCCLGRNDSVVKIRGYRLSTVEIEAYIDTHPKIRSSLVEKKQINSTDLLVSYYISQSEFDKEDLSSELHHWLEQSLPAYMLPSYYVKLTEWPRTTNQKINRFALPMPDDRAAEDHYKTSKARIVAEDNVTVPLLEIIRTALKNDLLLPDDNLFAHGLTSLGAINLWSQLISAGYQLEIGDLFHFPTVRQLEGFLYEYQ